MCSFLLNVEIAKEKQYELKKVLFSITLCVDIHENVLVISYKV